MFSLFYYHFAFVDTKGGIGIELLLQNGVRFLNVISCLQKRVLIYGNNDYPDYCTDLCKELGVPAYQEGDCEKRKAEQH